jgi:hypothetical protein
MIKLSGEADGGDVIVRPAPNVVATGALQG